MIRADLLAAKILATAWQRISYVRGSKGDRFCHVLWADAGPGIAPRRVTATPAWCR